MAEEPHKGREELQMESPPQILPKPGHVWFKLKPFATVWIVATLVASGVLVTVALMEPRSATTQVSQRGQQDAWTTDMPREQSRRPRSTPVTDVPPSIPPPPSAQKMLRDALGKFGEVQRQTQQSRPAPPIPAPETTPAVHSSEPAATARPLLRSPAPDPSRQTAPPAEDLKSQTNSIGMQLVLLPSGRYRMGDQGDAVDVTLSKGFWIGKTEVTQSEWQRVMAGQPGFYSGVGFNDRKGAKLPAVGIYWADAMRFCDVLTAMERSAGRIDDSQRYRLPTEAEWEYACRAGSATRFCYGDEDSQLTTYAWCYANAFNVREPYAHDVASKEPNAWGLYDMHGNVKEWCLDDYSKKLPGGLDPFVQQGGGRTEGYKVVRGGTWRDFPHFHQCSYRADEDPTSNGLDDRGFRVVLAPAGRF